MPQSEKQRKAAFAEVARRKGGGSRKLFRGMGTSDLESYAREPLHGKGKGGGKKKGGKGGKGGFSAFDQGRALRRGASSK